MIKEAVEPLLHNNDPVKSDAVNTELPQLLTTVTVGAPTAELNGDAVPLPAGLLHPFTVCVTVYVPASATVIAGVVAPLLHNKVPLKALAVNTELPQLSTAVTTGTEGDAFGVATILPSGLTHSFTVWVTVNVPAFATVINDAVSPVLHNNEPVNELAVNNELSQLSEAATRGADGIIFGAARPIPAGLAHPPTVWVTV